MNLIPFVLLAASLFAASPMAAELQEEADDEAMIWDGMPLRRSCDRNTITLNECAYAVWKKADDELNAVYQEQLRYLRGTEMEYLPGRGASGKLIAAQRAWLAFRDRDCEYQLGEPGGSGDTFEILKCQYKRAISRIAELREYTACRSNGCPY